MKSGHNEPITEDKIIELQGQRVLVRKQGVKDRMFFFVHAVDPADPENPVIGENRHTLCLVHADKKRKPRWVVTPSLLSGCKPVTGNSDYQWTLNIR